MTFVPTPVPVVVSWSVSNADSVYIAVPQRRGPYETNLALTGTREIAVGLPRPAHLLRGGKTRHRTSRTGNHDQWMELGAGHDGVRNEESLELVVRGTLRFVQ